VEASWNHRSGRSTRLSIGFAIDRPKEGETEKETKKPRTKKPRNQETKKPRNRRSIDRSIKRVDQPIKRVDQTRRSNAPIKRVDQTRRSENVPINETASLKPATDQISVADVAMGCRKAPDQARGSSERRRRKGRDRRDS